MSEPVGNRLERSAGYTVFLHFRQRSGHVLRQKSAKIRRKCHNGQSIDREFAKITIAPLTRSWKLPRQIAFGHAPYPISRQRGGTMIRGIAQAGVLLATLVPALAGPSPAGSADRCRKAEPGYDQKVCTSAELAELDREVQAAFDQAFSAVGSSGKGALKRDQLFFDRARDNAARMGDQDMSLMLSMRRDFLKSIAPVKPDAWTGSWGNLYGTIEILAKGDQQFYVRLSAADPVSGAWTCEFEDSAVLAPRGIAMIVGAESAADDHGGPNEGWTLAFRIAGDILMVEPLRPKGHGGAMPFCTKGGNVAGNFFSQDHTRPEAKQARNN